MEHRKHIPGWVYILSNPAMPGLLKIGFTSRDPSTRMQELTAATGVPVPFELVWCRAVSDCAGVELAVHRMLADRRAHYRREFFRVDAGTARQVIEAAAGARLGKHYRMRRARSRAPRWQSGQGRGRRHSSTEAALFVIATAAVLALSFWRPQLLQTLLHLLHVSV